MKKALLLAAIFMLSVFVQGAVAQESKAPKEKKEPVVSSAVKQVQGEVANITKRSISIVFSRDDAGGEQEMMFSLGSGDIKVEHKRGIGEIAQGDTVLIIYSEETSDYGDRKDISLKPNIIRFIKPADVASIYKPKAVVPEEPETAEALTLKGVK